MKRLLPILLLVFSVGVGAETMDDLVKRDGLYHKQFTDVPFTGNITGRTQGTIRDGKKEGSWVSYWPNGQVNCKGTYTDGKMEGVWICYYNYYNSGLLATTGTYKDHKREGIWEVGIWAVRAGRDFWWETCHQEKTEWHDRYLKTWQHIKEFRFVDSCKKENYKDGKLID